MTVPAHITDAIKRINPLSDSAVRLMSIIGNREHTLQDVVRIVETDSTLAARILRTVNSAAFGLTNSVDSVNRAVSYLGDKTVAGIALEICASSLYQSPLDGYMTGKGQLWRHCLRTAIASREIAKHSKSDTNPEVAYTAGLLHDIGKSVLDEWLSKRAPITFEALDAGEEDFQEAEKSLIDTDHAEAGALLISAWGLPRSLQEAVRHHHSPSQASEEYSALTYAVHLGDFLAMMGGTGTGIDTLQYTLDPAYGEYFTIDPHELDRVSFQVGQEYAKTIAALGDAEGDDL